MYSRIIEKIDNAHRFGNLTGAEIMPLVLQTLGHPEKEYPFIHVAGTNGKGSTCAFMEQILMDAGVRVGKFTSPHLVDFEERITVNGKMISKADVERIGKMVMEMDFGVQLTYFDYCLTFAVIYFMEQKVEVAIMETGLGGTWDSTNALGKPLAAVITKIGMDHTAILGDTLGRIAGEKAGIIKEGVPVFLETQEPEAMEVLLAEAEKRKASQIVLVTKEDIAEMAELSLKLPGVHQWENAALAAKTIRSLYPEIGEEQMKASLAKTTWPGRMEVLSEEPFFMVDGAHNGHGVKALAASLAQLWPGEKFHFFTGVLADKDYEAMMEDMLPLAQDFHTVTLGSSRALQAKDLAAFIEKHGIEAATLSDITEIPGSLYPEGRNIAFGSLYFVGELKNLMK